MPPLDTDALGLSGLGAVTVGLICYALRTRGTAWRGVRARIGLWFPAGCVAARPSRVRVDGCGGQPLAPADA
jgi:hypothetical protein